MGRRGPGQPTNSELEILTILWDQGASILRQLHNAVLRRRKVSLTTTLKTVQIMTAKGLVKRDDSGYPSRYEAAAPREKMQAELCRDLVQRAFGGSPGRLLMCAVKEGGISDEELREIHRLIAEVRKSKKKVKP